MIKNFFAAIGISVIVLSCGDGSTETPRPKEDMVIEMSKADQNEDLVYLDTAESIRNVLCQGWAIDDDEAALEGMTESSQIEIPYRSFFFQPMERLLKTPETHLIMVPGFMTTHRK